LQHLATQSGHGKQLWEEWLKLVVVSGVLLPLQQQPATLWMGICEARREEKREKRVAPVLPR
jgi:hypothetical protein